MGITQALYHALPFSWVVSFGRPRICATSWVASWLPASSDIPFALVELLDEPCSFDYWGTAFISTLLVDVALGWIPPDGVHGSRACAGTVLRCRDACCAGDRTEKAHHPRHADPARGGGTLRDVDSVQEHRSGYLWLRRGLSWWPHSDGCDCVTRPRCSSRPSFC